MANTNIYIKRSTTQDRPVSLGAGEFGYSYKSNTLFIGTPDGTGVINVGGVIYTGMLDSATNNSTGDTLVKRDVTGSASFNEVNANLFNGTFYGNANTATALESARNFSLNGDDVTAAPIVFDGTSDVVLVANLNVTGVTAGTFGGTTKIPVITVDDKGRLSYAANVDVATTLAYAGDTGTGSLNILNDTLDFDGGDGVTTTVDSANSRVVFDVDSTVIRTNGVPSQTINTDLNIVGNVSVTGNTYYHNVDTLNVADPLIYLASNNYTSDIVDIGFAGNYNDGTGQKHTGLVRIHASNEMYAFTNYDEEFNNNTLNIANPNLVLANLHASLTGGMVYGLANTINVVDGGTGQGTFNNGSILVGNGTGPLQVLANSTYTETGTLGSNNTVSSITVDSYGRLTNVTTQYISGLKVSQGGTGTNTFTMNGILFGNGLGSLQTTPAPGIADQSWTNQILTTTNSGQPVWASALDGGTF